MDRAQVGQLLHVVFVVVGAEALVCPLFSHSMDEHRKSSKPLRVVCAPVNITNIHWILVVVDLMRKTAQVSKKMLI